MLSLRPVWRASALGAAVLALLVVTAAASADSVRFAGDSRYRADEARAGLAAPEDFSINFSYFHAAGSAFTPRSSQTTWTYEGVGCVSASGGNDVFSLHLDLPQGARIDYLRLYFRDTSANDSTAWITTYDAAGGVTDLTAVSSSGAAGYGATLSPFVNHVVNNAARSYVLNWRADQTGSSMQLCGLRVAYRVAVNNTYLPALMKQ